MLPCSYHSPWWLNANSSTPGNEVAGSLMACYNRRRSSGWGGRGGGAGNFVLEVQTTTTMVIRDVRATRRVPGTRHGGGFPPVRLDLPARARPGSDLLAGKGSRFAPHGPPGPRAPLPGRLPGTCSRAPGAALAPATHEPPLLAVRRVQRGRGTRVRSSRAGACWGTRVPRRPRPGAGQGPSLPRCRASGRGRTRRASRPRVPGGGRGPGSRRRRLCSTVARHWLAPGRSESPKLP